MKWLDLTLDTPAENLALDEALLETAEATHGSVDDGEVLRVWEPAAPFVVLGRASKIRDEVDLTACAARGVPVLRRCSGGASIVTGPGCLMYGVVLSVERRPTLRFIDHAHAFVLGRVLDAVTRVAPGATFAGTSDLVFAGQRKFSGNSLRCKRTHLLYHGTLLYDFPLDLVGTCLRTPPRQPDYRAGRSHGEFVGNLPLDATALRIALAEAFGAGEPLVNWPRDLTCELVQGKYSQDDWNTRL